MDLIGRVSEHEIDLQLDASIMSLLFTEREDPSDLQDFQEVMEEVMEWLCEEEVASLPGFIAALALLVEHERECLAGDRARWTQADARLFLAATDHLCSFLEQHKEGSAEERVLAYGLLAQLLVLRQNYLTRVAHPVCVAVAQARLYAQLGLGDPFREACSAINQAEVPLEVVRMAALEGLPLGPALLRGLMSLDVQQGYTTSELSALLHGFVEAGGQPSGEQLALASLGALGFTHKFGQLGTRVSTFHNITTMRAAWHDLASLWQLASRPDVRGGLWPQLSASGVSANQVMEPLQDVVLFGVLGQLQFMANTNALTAWGLDELKEELHSVLQTSSLPASKVDALLHGDLESVLGRVTTLFTLTYAQWQIEGRWSVERRTYVPLLTRAIYSLAEDVDVPGARLGSYGRWEYDGTIAPRLQRGLMDTNGEEHAWAQRVFKEADGPMMKLLARAVEALGSGERD
eukprot:5270045-Prymnesium_polylepis.1